MAGRAAVLIVVFDASSFVSAALKANSVPERALLRAVTEPDRLILSRDIENEYREVIFRPKFDKFVSVERRRLILDTVIVAADRVEPVEAVRECSDPKDDKYLALAAAGRAGVIVSSMRATCSRCIRGAESGYSLGRIILHCHNGS
jgi:putative PIN family toxin of toxin-antitoxin system